MTPSVGSHALVTASSVLNSILSHNLCSLPHKCLLSHPNVSSLSQSLLSHNCLFSFTISFLTISSHSQYLIYCLSAVVNRVALNNFMGTSTMAKVVQKTRIPLRVKKVVKRQRHKKASMKYKSKFSDWQDRGAITLVVSCLLFSYIVSSPL